MTEALKDRDRVIAVSGHRDQVIRKSDKEPATVTLLEVFELKYALDLCRDQAVKIVNLNRQIM